MITEQQFADGLLWVFAGVGGLFFLVILVIAIMAIIDKVCSIADHFYDKWLFRKNKKWVAK